MGVVIEFAIPPKQETHRHMGVEYVLQFVPTTKQWQWSFCLTPSSRVKGKCPSYLEARTKARQTIALSKAAKR